MGEIMDDFKGVVERGGDQVGMDKPICKIHKADHENCAGCPSELGCGKLASLGIVMMMPSIYKPQGFEDFQKMHEGILGLQDRILNAKTVEELRAIPHI